MSKVRMCRCGCGKTATFVCSDCKSAAYYSEDCQKRDWPIHRQVCFAEKGLDVPSEETPKLVGVVFELRKSAIRLTEDQLRSFGMPTKKILSSLKYVANGIYCMPADVFDKEMGEPKSPLPYPGVRAEKGAIYLRGCAGTSEFEESMRNLSGIGSDVSAQSYLIYQNYEFMSEAIGSIEETLRTVVDPRGFSVDEKMEFLATMADLTLLVEGTPGYADLLNTANWVLKMQKFAAERAKISGTQVTEYSHQIERVLDGVWSRVDIGLYIDYREDVSRMAKIPSDLVRRCKTLSLPQLPLPEMLCLLDRSPNLTSVKFIHKMISGESTTFEEGETSLLFESLPRSLEKLSILEYSQFTENFNWVTTKMFPRLRKLKMWTPNSTEGIPSTVQDLTLNPRRSIAFQLSNMKVVGALTSVKKLNLGCRTYGDVFDAVDAATIIAAFPNLEILDLSKVGYDYVGFIQPVLAGVPSIVDLQFNVQQGIITELIAYLRTLKEPKMRTLRMIDLSPEPTVHISDADRVTLSALVSSGVVKKLGLCMGTEGVLTPPIRVRFDVLDVSMSAEAPQRLPPARILGVRGSANVVVSAMIDPGSRPKALLIGRGNRLRPIPEGALGELISLSYDTPVLFSGVIEWLETIMTAAPKLKYLKFEVERSGFPTHERATPIVHIPIDTLYVEMLDRVDPHDCLGQIVKTIRSPKNLIIDVHEKKVDPFLIGWIASEWRDVRTICVMSSSRDLYPSKKFYPVNVFSEDSSSLLDARFGELSWFTDPWRHEFDKL